MKAVEIPFPLGRIFIGSTPDEIPFGRRGVRPITIHLLSEHQGKIDEIRVKRYPGALVRGSSVQCTWDLGPILLQELGFPTLLDAELARRSKPQIVPPGMEKYKALGMPKILRQYQKDQVIWHLVRSWGIVADEPRMGKTLPALASTVALGSEHVLIISPALAKYEWAAQIKCWLGEEAVLLFGRGGDEARVHCKACNGSGLALEKDPDLNLGQAPAHSSYAPCETCKARNGQSLGERIVHARQLEAETLTHKWQEPSDKLKKDGTPRLVTRSAKSSVWPPVFRCPVHEDVREGKPGMCPRCSDDLDQCLVSHRYIIVNYDLLAAQRDRQGDGKGFLRDDLPGWGERLSKIPFDICLADEAHKLRGHAGKKEAGATSRRERFCEITDQIERVFLITATPIYTFTRDLWALLDSASKGLWS